MITPGSKVVRRGGHTWVLEPAVLGAWPGRNGTLAFEKGFTARTLDYPRMVTTNPYTREHERAAWFEGYRYAQRQERAS